MMILDLQFYLCISRSVRNAFFMGICGCLICIQQVSAHPLDDFTSRTIDQYVILDLRLEMPAVFYRVDMSEMPSFDEMDLVDPDYNREISGEEVDAYLDRRVPELLKNLYMTVEGVHVPLRIEDRVLSIKKGEGGLAVINIHLELKPESFQWQEQKPRLELVFRNKNFSEFPGIIQCKLLHNGSFEDQTSTLDKDVLGTQKSVSRSDVGNVIYQDKDGEFTFRIAPGKMQAAKTTGKPSFDWISLPKNVKKSKKKQTDLKNTPVLSGVKDRNRDAEIALSPETILSPKQTDENFLSQMSEKVTGIVRSKQLTTGMFVSGILITLFLGMAHAWSPGHGKTVMAAYLIGERGTIWHAVILGIVVTITHTWSVFALGFVTLYTQENLSSAQLNFWLSVASGGIIIAIGAPLFFKRYASFVLSRNGFKPGNIHPSNDHHHNHNLNHSHRHNSHSHIIETEDGSPPSIWRILGMGISGGIVPCPSALVVLLLAIQFKRLSYGIWLILSFSLGLAVVLVFIGIVVVRAGSVLRKSAEGNGVLAILPVISSAAITILGLVLLTGTLIRYGFLVIQI